MARVAVISDVHGNSVALELCLKSIQKLKPDMVICLGDSVGYYPDEKMCYEALEDIDAFHLMGNHEAMLIGLLPLEIETDEIYSLREARIRMTTTLKQRIAGFPIQKFLEIDGFVGEFYHGSPTDNLTGYVYSDTKVEPIQQGRSNHVFIGNTHRSFCSINSWGKVVNVGSVGMPRDSGDQGTYVVIDTDTSRVHRVILQLPVQQIKAKYPKVHPTVLECLNRRAPLAQFNG